VISAPSGAGKTTLTRAVLETFPQVVYSVSHTTRPPRFGEVDGRDYFFISPAEFKAGIDKGQWLEWAKVHGHYYGTHMETALDAIRSGVHLLLEIDVQGACQVKQNYPDTVTIFIMPPSLEVLEHRLKQRGTDSDEVIHRRLENAQNEMEQKDAYRYCIVNDDLNEARTRLIEIFKKELS
jgi:guanylate kinase